MPMLPSNVAPKIAWTLDPSVLVGVGALAIIYLLAWRRGRATSSAHRPGRSSTTGLQVGRSGNSVFAI